MRVDDIRAYEDNLLEIMRVVRHEWEFRGPVVRAVPPCACAVGLWSGRAGPRIPSWSPQHEVCGYRRVNRQVFVSPTAMVFENLAGPMISYKFTTTHPQSRQYHEAAQRARHTTRTRTRTRPHPPPRPIAHVVVAAALALRACVGGRGGVGGSWLT